MLNPPLGNTLYYGDNLEVLRKYIKDESIDLIYLDPPFNSQADYNVLFKEKTGERSTAQIQAFTDFWEWDNEAAKAYEYLTIHGPNDVANLTEAFRKFLNTNDMLAYLVMMGERLLELHRVLKLTGSIYLHCDPTASHYLKLMMDSIFGIENFRNEIIWRRSHPKGLAFTRFANNHDVILCYAKDIKKTKWNPMYRDYDKEKSDAQYRLHDPDGRAYQLTSLLNPNPNRPNLTYEFKGVTKVWRWTKERMLEEDAKGRIIVPRQGKGIPRYKRYFDEQEGIPIDDFWDDIEFAKGGERLGFPTQKPVELLERIINASSDQGDIVLDPFCGCGTAVIAAERLRRNWIGIDITYLAINLIKNRLRESYPSLVFKVEGEPKDLGAARQLAKESESDGRYQFQWWALTQIGAVAVGGTTANPSVGKKGADRAVDGWLRFAEGSEGHIGKILVQVKSGHVGVKEIREHRDAINRHGASMGIFITLEEPTSEMIKEVKITGQYKSPVWNTEYPKIQILTVEQILKGEKPNIPPISNMFKETSKMERKTETKQQKLS